MGRLHSMISQAWLARTRRWPRVIVALFLFELLPTIPALALYGTAAPNLYRTKLWLDGAMNGFNSNPKDLIYYYANYKTPPTIPLVWSQLITTWNLVISVLSMFILLVKSVAFVMHLWYPIMSLVVHIGLTAVYAFSVYSQLGSDLTDPDALQKGPPWYITKSCSVAYYSSDIGYCKRAKASVAIAVVMVALFLAQIILAIHSLRPSRLERRLRSAYDSDSDSEDLPASKSGIRTSHRPVFASEAPHELQTLDRHRSFAGGLLDRYAVPPADRSGRLPAFEAPPKTPMTPRTMALDRLTGRRDKQDRKGESGKKPGMSGRERRALEAVATEVERERRVARFVALQNAGPPSSWGVGWGGEDEEGR